MAKSKYLVTTEQIKYLLLVAIFSSIIIPLAESEEFNCVTIGKFEDPEDTSRYHQCFHLFGELTYIHNKCPFQTCFNPKLNYCHVEACLKSDGILEGAYNCTNKWFRCTNAGVFAYETDPSVYFRCSKLGAKLLSVCYTCNSKHKTCYSEVFQACIPNGGKPCTQMVGVKGGGAKLSGNEIVAGKGYGSGGSTIDGSETGGGNGKDTGGGVGVTRKDAAGGAGGTGKGSGPGSTGKDIGGGASSMGNESGGGPGGTGKADGGDPGGAGNVGGPGRGGVVGTGSTSGGSTSAGGSAKPSSGVGNGSASGVTGKPASNEGSSIKGNGNAQGGSGSTSSKPVTTTYDCEGYYHFPCDKLGLGTHSFPGDLSVYMECKDGNEGDMEGKCFPCPKKDRSLFIESESKCVEHRGNGSNHQPYNCSTFTVDDVDCETEGLIAYALETSVFFNCFKDGDAWNIQCFTCSNGKTKTCFSETQQACVTYSGPSVPGNRHKCPSITIIDVEEVYLVATPDLSLTWDCSGYNELSFPCKFFEEGEYDTPADRSIYFQCIQKGSKMTAVCQQCPSSTWSCYDSQKETCVKDCVSQVYLPYDCRNYNELSYPCTQPGYFSNPKDTSIYHQCTFKQGQGYKALCYACSNGFKQTCFDNEQQACITPGKEKKPCGTQEIFLKYIDRGTKITSLTYSIEGYSATSFPCKELGPGEWDKPGDQSVYVICGANGETEFRTCPKETNSCYDKDKKRCVENCGQEIIIQTVIIVISYDIRSVIFVCEMEGVFAYASDTSIYFLCLRQETIFIAVGFTCNSKDKTCYSEEQQACVQTKEATCGDVSKLPKDSQPFLSYSCDGYTENSFDCAKLGAGFFAIPGDKSVFVECHKTPGGELVGRCHACSKAGNTCYDKKTKVCVKNCGRGDLITPYNCSSFNDQSYPCSKAGFFAYSFDTSIYFECVKVEGAWKSYCYTCNSDKITCYHDKKAACVTNNKEPCWNTSMPQEGGEVLESLTHSCKGYTDTSFPCMKRGPGTFVMPGDHSVYFTCGANSEYKRCDTCPGETMSCYDETEKRCIENCGKGSLPKPYNCSSYTQNSFKCTKEGLFANPKDSSVYFRCQKDSAAKQGWRLEYFTCNSAEQTCFDDLAKTCVDSGKKACNGKTVEIVKIIVTGKQEWILRTEYRTYSCTGYEGFSFPCQKPGNFPLPGDLSIYYTCTESGGVLLPKCNACPKSSKSCFIESTNKCEDNCGKGLQVTGTMKQYDCSGYTLNSYPCDKEGLFANPEDPTVFFRCVKNHAGSWESWCYACNSVSKSCFKNDRQRCVLGCKSETTAIIYGDNGYGYGTSSIPCGPLFASQSATQMGVKTYYEHPGDLSVYFLIIQIGSSYKALCHRCPLTSCFDQKSQDCIAPCKDYVPPANPSGPFEIGPPVPYDCRFYKEDSYPCTEEGVFANPVDTSVYFRCIKDKKGFKAICYTCHSVLKTCFDEGQAVCVPSKTPTCGKIVVTVITVQIEMITVIYTYDITGYNILSLPCAQLGAGTHFLPGDPSVYFVCKQSGSEIIGEVFACSKEKNECFDKTTKKCKPNCIHLSNKPYSCETYDEKSFPCSKPGYFANVADSSVFFQCVKDTKTKRFIALCYTCNSYLKTCFSNKKQTCLTKGGQPCGEGDPADTSIGGSGESSKQFTCQGYNDLSFPCSYYQAGLFSTPADPSIYFSCGKFGEKWNAECKSCSKDEDGCFDDDQKICVENCGKGAAQPYKCDTYDDHAISCSKEGFFQNTKDSSVFFKCVKTTTDRSGWKTYCFSCNSKVGTCFDEKSQACISNKGKPCNFSKSGNGNGVKDLEKVDIQASMTYDCEGYNENSLSCSLTGLGKYVHPGDKSVYFECALNGGEITGKCNKCNPSRRECFIDKQKKCIENCGLGPHKPWNCATRKFTCESEGLFADTADNSVFHKCVKKQNGKLESQCFTCNNGLQKTCFSQKKQVCLLVKGGVCSKKDPIDLNREITEIMSMTYDYHGYNQFSFPCDKYPIPGTYPTPAEKSVYFECKNAVVNGVSTVIATCKACSVETQSIYDPVQGTCIQNLGKGPHKPYNCATYNDASFKCKDEGLFANPKDTSIFFRCVRAGTKWVSHCYSCSSTQKTCFSNSEQACITTGGVKCDGGDPVLGNDLAGEAESSMTYECSGYNEVSIPCGKLNPGKYGHPGDLSVYFTCESKNSQLVAVCATCDKTTFSCFDKTKGVKKCISNCLRGDLKLEPYNCKNADWKSYPCKEEGGYWAALEDTSVYFRCVMSGDRLEAICYTCNVNYKTCFSNKLQACITIGDETECGKSDPILFQTHGEEVDSRTYDITGYKVNPPHFPCADKGEGIHYFPGDRSVYVKCSNRVKSGVIIWIETFIVCENPDNGGFFNKETLKCEQEKKSKQIWTTRKPRPTSITTVPPTSLPGATGKSKLIIKQIQTVTITSTSTLTTKKPTGGAQTRPSKPVRRVIKKKQGLAGRKVNSRPAARKPVMRPKVNKLIAIAKKMKATVKPRTTTKPTTTKPTPRTTKPSTTLKPDKSGSSMSSSKNMTMTMINVVGGAGSDQSSAHLTITNQTSHVTTINKLITQIVSGNMSHLTTGGQSASHVITGEQSSTQHIISGEQSSTQHITTGEQSTSRLATGEQSASHLISGGQSSSHVITGEQSSTQHIISGEQSSAQHITTGEQSSSHTTITYITNPSNHTSSSSSSTTYLSSPGNLTTISYMTTPGEHSSSAQTSGSGSQSSTTYLTTYQTSYVTVPGNRTSTTYVSSPGNRTRDVTSTSRRTSYVTVPANRTRTTTTYVTRPSNRTITSTRYVTVPSNGTTTTVAGGPTSSRTTITRVVGAPSTSTSTSTVTKVVGAPSTSTSTVTKVVSAPSTSTSTVTKVVSAPSTTVTKVVSAPSTTVTKVVSAPSTTVTKVVAAPSTSTSTSTTYVTVPSNGTTTYTTAPATSSKTVVTYVTTTTTKQAQPATDKKD